MNIAKAVLTLLALASFCYFCFMALRSDANEREFHRALREMALRNPYAHLLGKTVEAKVYEGSEWERMVIVAVSWKGAVAVRPVYDLETKARWIHKDKVPDRVREIDA